MSQLILNTSGSTDEPKLIEHDWTYINRCAELSIQEIGLSKDDIVLDVFPANTIAHYSITAYPAILSGAKLVSANFNPFHYLDLFEKFRPTIISLIPRHLELLSKLKKWQSIDMSCVRYMATGSNKIHQSFIDAFKNKGVQIVANWYGMTEFPPPVLVGYNTTKFDLERPNKMFNVEFGPPINGTKLSECIINGVATGDLFDLNTNEFYSRILDGNRATWKTSV